MADNDALEAAIAEQGEVPLIDFDEGTRKIVARVRIAGEVFDVPPMPASTVRYFAEIQGAPMDDNAWDLCATFIVKCLLPEDEARGRAAMDNARMSLTALMEKGAQLIKLSAGFPTQLPSPLAPSSPNGSGSTTAGLSPPGIPASSP